MKELIDIRGVALKTEMGRDACMHAGQRSAGRPAIRIPGRGGGRSA